MRRLRRRTVETQTRSTALGWPMPSGRASRRIRPKRCRGIAKPRARDTQSHNTTLDLCISTDRVCRRMTSKGCRGFAQPPKTVSEILTGDTSEPSSGLGMRISKDGVCGRMTSKRWRGFAKPRRNGQVATGGGIQEIRTGQRSREPPWDCVSRRTGCGAGLRPSGGVVWQSRGPV